MNDLDDEAEAFFRSGDEGNYEGGPASMVPLVLSEEPAEPWPLRSADEWLERRRRVKRFVARVVGGLSAGLVVLSVCLLGARARTAEESPRRPAPASLPPVTNATNAPVPPPPAPVP